MSAALAMIGPQMGASFAVYEWAKHVDTLGWLMPRHTGEREHGVIYGSGDIRSREGKLTGLSTALAGMYAGICGKLIVFPLDTVKKRVQTQVRAS